MFAIVTLICLVLGLFLQSALRYSQRKSQARSLIMSVGGNIQENGLALDGPPGGNWLTRQIGLSNSMERLWAVDLSGTAITAHQAAKLDGCDWIRRLDLSGTVLKDDDLKFLRGLPKLRELRLNDTGITDDGLEHVKLLKRLLLFESKNTGINWEGLTELDQSFPEPRSFADRSVIDSLRNDGVTVHCPLETETPGRDEFHLRLLHPSRARTVRVTDGRLVTEATFLALGKLTDVRSFLGSFGNTPFLYSERILNWRELRSVSIDGGLLTDEDFRHIASLPKLRYLYLVGSHKISDQAVLMLGDNATLENLTLDGRQNSLEITRHLGGLKALKSLKLSAWIGVPKTGKSLTNSERENATIEALQRLKSLPNLENLQLYGNAFPDKAILSLADFSQLKQIVVSDEYLAPETIRQLKANLPNCDVRNSRQGFSYSEILD